MYGVGPMILVVLLFYPFFHPFIRFEEEVRRPIREFFNRLAGDLCCEKQTVPRKVGQNLGYDLARLAYHLPFYRDEILEFAIPFIARFDDGEFFALIIWEREENAPIVRKAIHAALPRVGYIEDVFKEQMPITTLLREFVHDESKTLRGLLYSHPRYHSHAPV